jgi:hypothetical protein
MSVMIRFSPPALQAAEYDTVVQRLWSSGVFPAEGLEHEICFGTDGNLSVSQVWDTQEQLDAFAQQIMPILAEFGIDPGQPEVFAVHNTITR